MCLYERGGGEGAAAAAAGGGGVEDETFVGKSLKIERLKPSTPQKQTIPGIRTAS